MGMDLWDALDVQRAAKWQKFLAGMGMKVYLGHEIRPDWQRSLPFYLFQCPKCEKLVKDYPHSWPEEQHFHCPECGARWISSGSWLVSNTSFLPFCIYSKYDFPRSCSGKSKPCIKGASF